MKISYRDEMAATRVRGVSTQIRDRPEHSCPSTGLDSVGGTFVCGKQCSSRLMSYTVSVPRLMSGSRVILD